MAGDSTAPNKKPIPVGVSACLLGQEVRFDGGHKRDRYLTGALSRFFQWVPVCPEVECGLPIPRPAMRLQSVDGQIRLVTTKDQTDLTDRMREFAQCRVADLVSAGLRGFVLKKGSPSCGMERVKVYAGNGPPRRAGRGLFAAELLARYPNLPVEEEGRLHDPRLRENWITRVFAYHSLQSLWNSDRTPRTLRRFHSAYKLMLLAHSPVGYRHLSRLVDRAERLSREDLRLMYETIFMTTLSKPVTRAGNTNVLRHMLGYFKKNIDTPAKKELLGHIRDYRKGYVPLVVPLTLISHYIRMYQVHALADQIYLNPYPKDLVPSSEV